jgi:hypothetical protein
MVCIGIRHLVRQNSWLKLECFCYGAREYNTAQQVETGAAEFIGVDAAIFRVTKPAAASATAAGGSRITQSCVLKCQSMPPLTPGQCNQFTRMSSFGAPIPTEGQIKKQRDQ